MAELEARRYPTETRRIAFTFSPKNRSAKRANCDGKSVTQIVISPASPRGERLNSSSFNRRASAAAAFCAESTSTTSGPRIFCARSFNNG